MSAMDRIRTSLYTVELRAHARILSMMEANVKPYDEQVDAAKLQRQYPQLLVRRSVRSDGPDPSRRSGELVSSMCGECIFLQTAAGLRQSWMSGCCGVSR
jgi:hypothetical protein